MYFGADYYPEHWPKERWAVDAKLMKEAGLNLVRLAEFAWSKIETVEGSYDFGWLDEAIEVLSVQGIKIVLGTPTASPPKWLMDKHPDIYQTDHYGRVKKFGSRRHYCANNAHFHEFSHKIVEVMAKHYQGNNNIVVWQVDNEFGCHDHICFCEDCRQAFQQWLSNKYDEIGELNKEWGTVFWSQTYNSFEEVIVPSYTQCDGVSEMSGNDTHNPGLLLDYMRFQSDAIIKYQKLQLDIIRQYSDKPITHNLMGHFSELDYYGLGKDLDFISWDNYITFQWRNYIYEETSMAHDIMRGIKNKNFWVMEQQSGPCGWNIMGRTPKPGQLRLWTHQAIAHGAEAIVYFRWRACTVGIEQYWHGILDHDGIPRRRYEEIKQMGQELHGLYDYVQAEPFSEVAVVKSYDNVWSHDIQPHCQGFDYNELLMAYHKSLTHNNVQADVISIDNNLKKYKLLVFSAFNLMTDAYREKLEDYVTDGGNLVITFRSGTRTWNNAMTTRTLPGYFKDLTGIELEEFDALGGDETIPVKCKFGTGNAALWCDIIKPIRAETLGTYDANFYKDKPAITVNHFGKGSVYYIGCDLDDKSLEHLMADIMKDISIEPIFPTKIKGVEFVRKQADNKTFTVVLNHNPHPIKIEINNTYKDIIKNIVYDKSFDLESNGVAILE